MVVRPSPNLYCENKLHTKQTPLQSLSFEEKSFPSSDAIEITPALWEQAIRWYFLNLSTGSQLDLLSEFISFHALEQHKEQENS